jgi:hypothetical protein
MNSAGLEAASPISTFILPSKTSCGVMLSPNPTFTKKSFGSYSAYQSSRLPNPCQEILYLRFYDGATLDDLKGLNKGVYNAIIKEANKTKIVLPPSGAVAGVYFQTDTNRGVWKAPANVALTSVSGPSLKITADAQKELNVHSTGKSINAIRSFTGQGTKIWGARTLDGNDNDWRYVNVRRLFNYVEESIQKSTSWAVFEANDVSTHIRVKTQIQNFLTGIWKSGGLVGAVAAEAFFVKVGLGESMTPQDVLEGRMNVEIGLAASRPAEFIILKFSHIVQES